MKRKERTRDRGGSFVMGEAEFAEGFFDVRGDVDGAGLGVSCEAKVDLP